MSTIRYTLACLFLLMSLASIAQAQVEGSSTESSDAFILEKRVPKGEDAGQISFGTDGQPKKYYIIQLARFEKMYEIPPEFPKGTTLWFNPDIGVEAILISSQMYRSYETAYTAAEKIKRKGIYTHAFARPHPFLVKYE